MPVSTETLLELRDVDFGYGDRLVLSNLNMRFTRGQVVAVMGGSGCGKTTLLRLIGGLVKANRGQVLFGGQDAGAQTREGLYALRRKMGMLFQFGALFTDQSVFENVAFPLREHTEPARRPDPRPGADEAPGGGPARRRASDAVGDLGRHGAARGARARDRARSRS